MNRIEFINFCELNYFNSYFTEKITNVTKNQQSYMCNHLKLVIPVESINSYSRFYTFNQLKELKLIYKMSKEFKIKKTQLKIAKDVLKSIDESKNLSDKSVIYAYGELYFINTKDTEKKIHNLMNKNTSQLTFIGNIILDDLEKEINDNVKSFFNFSEYQHKKSLMIA